MNIEILKREVRPVDVLTLSDASMIVGYADFPGHLEMHLSLLNGPVSLPRKITGPVLITDHAGRVDSALAFHIIAGKMPYGSVICMRTPESAIVKEAVEATAAKHEWREWRPAGVDANEMAFVRSHWDGNTYGTHARYLEEAVKLTTGPVLELGCGDGSTRMLHEVCCTVDDGRMIVSIDNNVDWLNRFLPHLTSDRHRLEYMVNPAAALDRAWGTPDPAVDKPRWGVVFIDHAPGHTRKDAIERARSSAEYIVVHDTEELGYNMWSTLETFTFKRTFRYMRPWTTVVSMTREIFADPYGVEK